MATKKLEMEDGGGQEELPSGFLPWSEDLEMVSKFLDRKRSLIEEHSQFVREHPELVAILGDFVQSLLIHKPENVFQFAYEFFAPYSPILQPNPPHLSVIRVSVINYKIIARCKPLACTCLHVIADFVEMVSYVPVVQYSYCVEIPSRIFVGNLPYDSTETELKEFFSKYGNIIDCKIIHDRYSGMSKGYGFVTFNKHEVVEKLTSMRNLIFKSKEINISKAVRKNGGQYERPNKEYIEGIQNMLTNQWSPVQPTQPFLVPTDKLLHVPIIVPSVPCSQLQHMNRILYHQTSIIIIT